MNIIKVAAFCIFPLYALQAGSAQAQTKILFDATKAETAGGADWVIDADQHNLDYYPNANTTGGGNESNAQRLPTPTQSGITASTAETYWTGALSAWGVNCVQKGYTVETLPWNGSITYGNSSNLQDLSNYKVFVICEPNIQFTATEKTAIVNFVQAGGGLFIVSDHDQSDRNNDGWDSPAIWNDLMSSNTVQTHPFGITFDLVDISQTTSNVSATATDSIIHGPAGNVTQVKWSDGTTMTLNTTQNSTVKGVIFKTGTAAGTTNVMAAYGRYGAGKFVAIGDSSPCDDGTGDPNDVLYNGWTADASGNHQKLIMNMTTWLATPNPSAAITTPVIATASGFSAYPNPSNGIISIAVAQPEKKGTIAITNSAGAMLYQVTKADWQAGEQLPVKLQPGIYFIRMTQQANSWVERVLVQ